MSIAGRNGDPPDRGSRLLLAVCNRTGIKSHRPAPKAVAAALYASAGDPKKLSLPNPAKPIPISHAHSYGINRAYLTAKDGSSRSGSRADHERARITNARRAAEELFKPKPQAPGETAPIGGLLPLEDPAHVVAG